MRHCIRVVAASLVTLITACAGGSGGNNSDTSNKDVTVKVSGLTAGTVLTLVNNDGFQRFAITNDGPFTTQVPFNSSYSFKVEIQPAGEVCTVNNGAGTAGANLDNVLVSCIVPPFINATTDVTTFAGTGVYGYQNGDAAVAKFSNPSGVAVDSADNVYVADHRNQVIRKISPSGTVSTLAGSGSVGHSDGIGTAASFNGPEGVAVDPAGNVYVADRGNNMIRKITPSGVVTTVAGSGFPGRADGTGTQATFYSPTALTLDSRGNIYVADGGYGALRKITPAGVVTTLSTSLSSPTGIAIDSKGNLFVADGKLVLKISPDGEMSWFAGSDQPGHTNGVGMQARFFNVNYIAVDANDNLYVSETQSDPLSPVVSMKIRVITPLGAVSDYAGSGAVGHANGNGAVATFYDPAGMGFDSSGNLYVADSSNYMIRKIKRLD